MAVTAQFVADFRDFEAGVTRGEALLGDFSTRADSTSKAIDRMTGSGRANVGTTNTMRESFGQFDSILSSVGINIGGTSRALDEIASASGKTTSQLGALGTAGLAVGTAFAAFNLTRKAGEYFGVDWASWDQKIGDVTARLLGFGDATQDIAENNLAVLARASKLAGVEITSLELATELLSGTVAHNADVLNTSARRVAGWNQEIARVTAAGDMDELTKDVESQNFSLKELSDRYNISVDAIQFFAREQKNAAEAQKKADEEIIASNKKKLDDLNKALEANRKVQQAQADLAIAQGHATEVLSHYDQQLVDTVKHHHDLGLSIQDIAALTGKTTADIDVIIAALAKQGNALDEAHAKWLELEAAQKKAAEEMALAAEASAARQAKAFDDAVAKIIADQQRISDVNLRTYDLSTPEGLAEFKRLNPSATIGNIPADYFKTHTLEDAIRDGLIDLYGGYRGGRGAGGGATGGTGGPWPLPPLLPVVGAGGVPSTTVVVNGSVLSTSGQLSRAIGTAVADAYRSQGLRIGSGT